MLLLHKQMSSLFYQHFYIGDVNNCDKSDNLSFDWCWFLNHIRNIDQKMSSYIFSSNCSSHLSAQFILSFFFFCSLSLWISTTATLTVTHHDARCQSFFFSSFCSTQVRKAGGDKRQSACFNQRNSQTIRMPLVAFGPLVTSAPSTFGLIVLAPQCPAFKGHFLVSLYAYLCQKSCHGWIT